MTQSRLTSTLALLFSGVLAACASTPKIKPSDAVRHAGDILRQAAEQHVDDYAAPALKLARSKYAAAEKALKGPKPEQATELAQESIASAQLASIQAAGARANANKLSVQRQVERMEQLTHPSANQATTASGDDQ